MQGLKKFVNDFHLLCFYNVNDCKHVPEQIYALCTVIWALVAFCVGAYDGWHRFSLCCYFATGYFNPTSSLLQKHILVEMVKGVKENHFKDSDLFHEQTFQVTIYQTQEDGDLQVAYNIMDKLGGKTTTSQELSVFHSYTTIQEHGTSYKGWHSTTFGLLSHGSCLMHYTKYSVQNKYGRNI